MKTGLEFFDIARAYGLAQLVDCLTPEEAQPVILDFGSHYVVEIDSERFLFSGLEKNQAWLSLFVVSGEREHTVWDDVFLTDIRKNRSQKVNKVRQVLEANAKSILEALSVSLAVPDLFSRGGETLPGPLDPAAFKGLRGKTRGEYQEGQTPVDSVNWALACLGASISGYYKSQITGNQRDYFVLFLVPERFELANFRQISNISKRDSNLRYISVQNAAAHFSVIVADLMREMAAQRGKWADRFSTVLYFSMFQAGNQMKPAAGGRLSLHNLMDFALSKPGLPSVSRVFEVWKYLFRRGSVQGCEDLAESITALVMNPSIETYERHVKIFLRYAVSGSVKKENFYDNESMEEVVRYVCKS